MYHNRGYLTFHTEQVKTELFMMFRDLTIAIMSKYFVMENFHVRGRDFQQNHYTKKHKDTVYHFNIYFDTLCFTGGTITTFLPLTLSLLKM